MKKSIELKNTQNYKRKLRKWKYKKEKEEQ
jgi:hypothetical protein